MNKKTNLLIIIAVIAIGVGGVVTYQLRTTEKVGVEIHSDALLAKVTKDELLRESDAVVIGTVQNIKSFQAPSQIRPGEEDILSNATIAVSEYIYNKKEFSSQQIIVQFLGGEVANTKMVVDDGPSFKIGQRVIAFLKQKEDGVFTVVGWAQGKYTIDDASGQVGVGMERVFVSNIFGQEITVEEFKKQIHAYQVQ